MKFFLIVLSVFLITCNKIEKGPISGSDQTSILNIDLEENDTIYMSDIFTSVNYIKLKKYGDNLIGNIDKIIANDNTIFILTKSIHSIFLYDFSGNYINHVEVPEGRGPKELAVIKDFIVNNEDRELITLGHNKINKYSFSGNFIHSKHLKVIPDKIAQLPMGGYALFMNNEIYNSKEITDKPYNLLYFKENGIAKKFLPIDKYKSDLGFTVPNNFPQYRDHQLLYFHPSYTIYKLESSEISPRYVLDFGEHNIPPSLFKQRKNLLAGHKFIKKTLDGKYASYLANFLETDELIYFSILWDRTKAYSVFYPTKTNKVYVAKELINDIDGGVTPYFTASYKNNLMASIQPTDILKKVEKLKKMKEEKLNEQQYQLIQLANELDAFDNPIIMLGKVKANF